MNQNISPNNIEKQVDLKESPLKKTPEFNDKEVTNVAEGLGREASAEALGMDESAETTGRVSEVLTDSDEKKSGGQMASRKNAKASAAQVKAHLLKNIPEEKVMRKQVKKEINKEIKYLRKKALKMVASPGSMDYFEMSNLMKKIRELKDILSSLVKASIQRLKTLWLRFVHGVI